MALGASLALPAGAAAVVRPDAGQVSMSALPQGGVEEVLAGVPLGDLSAARLSEALAQLPGLGKLQGTSLQQALAKTVEALAGEGDTLGQLLSSPELVSKLETQLTELLSVSELLELPTLLNGESLSSVLSGALGSANASQLLATLLASSSEPEKLLEQILAATNAGALQALLGSTLSGTSFTKGTVGELASQLGTTPEAIAQQLNTTTTQLPSSAMALTAPLTDGKTLGVLDGLDGLDLGLLGSGEEAPGGVGGSGGGTGGGAGGSAGSGGAGGSGGSGAGSGSSGTPGGTSVVVNELTQGAPASGPGAKAAGRLRVVSRRVRGDVVTVVVQVPAAGRLVLAGSGVKRVSEQLDRPELVTLHTAVTKTELASLRAHRRRVSVTLHAAFTAVGGSSSAASTTVSLR
ncbi:MAG TPA: hypothetical protein VK790_09005 [Solirubrobacteraceae bacterium]|nr:hypothetical protein [Solirubrobacteraceae bacterium]